MIKMLNKMTKLAVPAAALSIVPAVHLQVTILLRMISSVFHSGSFQWPFWPQQLSSGSKHHVFQLSGKHHLPFQVW